MGGFVITKEHILDIHTMIVGAFNDLDDLRSEEALDQILHQYNEACEDCSTFTKAHILFYGMIRKQPFLDCNNGTAVVAVSTYLLMNGFTLQAKDQNLMDLIEGIIVGKISREETKEWLCEHIMPAPNDSSISLLNFG